MALKLQGGVKLPEFRNSNPPFMIFDNPLEVSLVMEHGLLPLVENGDRVKRYEQVARNPEDFVMASPISGVVTEVSENFIVIKNDGEGLDSPEDEEKPKAIDEIDYQTLTGLLKKYGVAGAFSGIPLYKKLAASYGGCERIIINCIESDPMVRHVRGLILENSKELSFGIKILLNAMGVKKAVIALDKDDIQLRDELKRFFPGRGGVVFAQMEVKYPIGYDRLLVNAIYNTEITSDKEVWQAGYPVISAETVINLFVCLQTGRPVISKTLTSFGVDFSCHTRVRAALGTGIAELFSHCGLPDGFSLFAMGGVLNGITVDGKEPVRKNTNLVLALREKEISGGVCIKCSRCLGVCPMHLAPFKFHENHLSGRRVANKLIGLFNCIECGACAYVCPGRVDILGDIRKEKAKLNIQNTVMSGKQAMPAKLFNSGMTGTGVFNDPLYSEDDISGGGDILLASEDVVADDGLLDGADESALSVGKKPADGKDKQIQAEDIEEEIEDIEEIDNTEDKENISDTNGQSDVSLPTVKKTLKQKGLVLDEPANLPTTKTETKTNEQELVPQDGED